MVIFYENLGKKEFGFGDFGRWRRFIGLLPVVISAHLVKGYTGNLHNSFYGKFWLKKKIKVWFFRIGVKLADIHITHLLRDRIDE